MNPGGVAFRDQLRLGGQPILHILSRERTLIEIIEVGPAGHFVRGCDKINFVQSKLRCCR